MLKSGKIPFCGAALYCEPLRPGWVLCPENLIVRTPCSSAPKPSSPAESTPRSAPSAPLAANRPMIVSGSGAHMTDADGNRYLDYVLSWGPLMLGHCAPAVVEAVIDAARKGTSFGASTPSEADLAEEVIRAFPSMEKVRFVSSGTEATMSAIRLARAATNRKYIVKFEGCYHGHSDALLVKAGSGVATFGIPGSAGVPEEFVQFTLALPYNNVDALEAAFAKFKGQIACVIIEPVVGNMGCVPPQARLPGSRPRPDPARGNAADLRRGDDRLPCQLRRRAGTLSHHARPDHAGQGHRRRTPGRRLRRSGGSDEPDLAARSRLSGRNAQRKSAGHGRRTRHAQSPRRAAARRFIPRSTPLAAKLVAGVTQAAKDAGIAVTANQVGSMFTWFFTDRAVFDWDTAARCNTELFGRFHRGMLDAGIWLPPSQFEAAFLSTAHTAADIDATIAAARKFLPPFEHSQPVIHRVIVPGRPFRRPAPFSTVFF